MASKRSTSTVRPEAPPSYTLELQLDKQRVVILGGGNVTRRKLPSLLLSGAIIDLIDPAELPTLPRHPQLSHHKRCYRPADLAGARLIFAATDDPQLNAEISASAKNLGILCCRIDSAAGSDFTNPALLRRPPLRFSVSTGGSSPAMAAALRDLLAEMIPRSWQTATELAEAIRRKVLTERRQIPYNQQVLLQLIEQGLLDFIAESDTVAIERLLLEHFGAGFAMQDLQFSLPEGTP